MLGNANDALGVPTFNVSIVFYTLCKHAGQHNWFPGRACIQCFCWVLHALKGCWATQMISWKCPHSTILLCFTRFERNPGNKADSLGVPTEKNYLVNTIKCKPRVFEWGSALTFGFRTHQSALTKAHSPGHQLQMSAGYVFLQIVVCISIITPVLKVYILKFLMMECYFQHWEWE